MRTRATIVPAAALGGVRTGLAAILLAGRHWASTARMSATILNLFGHDISFSNAKKVSMLENACE